MAQEPRKRRIWLWVAIASVVLVSAGLLTAEWVASRTLRGKLVALAAEHLDANLDAGTVLYWPPYGLYARDVSLTPRSGSGVAVEVKSIRLMLAGAPLEREGPLIIEAISLHGPTVTLVDGEPQDPQRSSPPDREPIKFDSGDRLSDVFRLKHMGISDGSFVHRSKHGQTMTWRGIDVSTTLAMEDFATYRFVAAGGMPGAVLDTTGKLNIDTMRASLENFVLKVRRDGSTAADEAVPATVVRLLEEVDARGELRLDVGGEIDLKHPEKSNAAIGLKLNEASARLPGWPMPLDELTLNFDLRIEGGKPLVVMISNAQARFGAAMAGLARARARVDVEAGTWAMLEEASGAIVSRGGSESPWGLGGHTVFRIDGAGTYRDWKWDTLGLIARLEPSGVTLRPAQLPETITELSAGSIELRHGVVTLSDIKCKYGGDAWSIAAARLPLVKMDEVLGVEDLDASVNFAETPARYPGRLGQVLEKLRPGGEYHLAGKYAFHPRRETGRHVYEILVGADDGELRMLDGKLAMTRVVADVIVREQRVDIEKFRADALDGKVALKSTIDTRRPFAYGGQLELAGVNLEKALALQGGEAPPTVPGKVNLRAQVQGAVHADLSPRRQLLADGEFEIVEGNFGQIPFVARILEAMGVSREAVTASEAAAVFRISEDVATLNNAGLNAPVVGLHGTGMVTLDGSQLDLQVVAAPLADWRQQVKSTGIPLVSDVAGEVLGVFQNILNATTSKLLYQFDVKGSLKNPTVTAIPTPILTEQVARIFGVMIHKERDAHLLEELKK